VVLPMQKVAFSAIFKTNQPF
jgi:hypothetical protein